MLTLKNIIAISAILFHAIIITLLLSLDQSICMAETTQISNSQEINQTTNNIISNSNLKTRTWIHKIEYISSLSVQANKRKLQIPIVTQKLNNDLMPIYEEVQNLYLLHSLYANEPRILAIVRSHFKSSKTLLQDALAPAILAKNLTTPLLLKTVQIENLISKTIPDSQIIDADVKSSLIELQEIKNTLDSELKYLDNSLNLAKSLDDGISTALKKINVQLPELWYSHYLAPPVNYLKKSEWAKLPLAINKDIEQYKLRLPMEFPQSYKEWSKYLKYFFIMLFFGGLLGFYFNHYFKKNNIDSYFSNIFRTHIPLVYIGIILVTIAAVIEHNYYGSSIFLLGNLLIIIGQILLAWDLRYIEKDKATSSPLLTVLPLTIIGYIIIYPEIPLLLLTLIWVVAICIVCSYRHFRPNTDTHAPLEKYIIYAESVTLWISLLIALLGLIQLSIIVYLFAVGICIAIQMSVSCMQQIHSISNHLSQETPRAIVNSLIIAMAAPLSIFLVFACFSLWIAALPGGITLISHYSILSFNVGETQFSIIKIFLFIGTFYLARAVISIGTALLHKANVKGLNVDESIIPPLQTALIYMVWGGYFLFVLYSLGMSWKSLAVVAGGLSVGVGFGLQSIVNNFLSGLILIFSRSIQEKDIIEIGGYIGTVQKINVRATTIQTFDNAMIYVPNSQFISSTLINWTRNSRSRRYRLLVGVAYDSDVELVTHLLLESTKDFEAVLKYPVPTVRFAEFGNSTLNFTLLFWITDYVVRNRTASSLRLKINKLFNEHNINIAYPQLDLHIVSSKNSSTPDNLSTPSSSPDSKNITNHLPKKNEQAQSNSNLKPVKEHKNFKNIPKILSKTNRYKPRRKKIASPKSLRPKQDLAS